MSDRLVLKLILCGDYGVGKSSLFRRFVYDSFVQSADRRSTLGFDHFEKKYDVEGREIILQLWDTGGLERIASVTTAYYKHAAGALLVFSYDALESFNALPNHMLEVIDCAEGARLFLCGNKSDLRDMDTVTGCVTQQDVHAFYREHQVNENENLFNKVYSTSCKTKAGVHEMFEDIARRLARNSATVAAAGRGGIGDFSGFQLRKDSQQISKGRAGCCSSADASCTQQQDVD